MSDTASQKNEIQPNIGDISAISSEMLKAKRKGKKGASKKVGDTQNVASTAVNDVLGDITLLEEAFAEMEVSVADYEQEIPLLHSAIADSSNEELAKETNAKEPEMPQPSIPLLDKQASEIIESIQENNDVANDVEIPELTPVTTIPTLDTQTNTEQVTQNVSISQFTQHQTAIKEASTIDVPDVEISIGEPGTQAEEKNAGETAEPASEQAEDIASTPANTESDEVLTASLEDVTVDLASVALETMNTEATLEINSATANATDQKNDDVSESTLSTLIESLDSSPGFARTQSSEEISVLDDQATTNTPSIEDKIAQASGDISANGSSQISVVSEHIDTEVTSELVIDKTPTTVTNKMASTTPSSDPSMSIPFELHSQLSKKIDDLVLDATMSLTTELQAQLSLQLESLLSNAVESVLPKLIDQMANELRAEVKGRVKVQLPIIVNEVLSKTRLT